MPASTSAPTNLRPADVLLAKWPKGSKTFPLGALGGLWLDERRHMDQSMFASALDGWLHVAQIAQRRLARLPSDEAIHNLVHLFLAMGIVIGPAQMPEMRAFLKEGTKHCGRQTAAFLETVQADAPDHFFAHPETLEDGLHEYRTFLSKTLKDLLTRPYLEQALAFSTKFLKQVRKSLGPGFADTRARAILQLLHQQDEHPCQAALARIIEITLLSQPISGDRSKHISLAHSLDTFLRGEGDRSIIGDEVHLEFHSVNQDFRRLESMLEQMQVPSASIHAFLRGWLRENGFFRHLPGLPCLLNGNADQSLFRQLLLAPPGADLLETAMHNVIEPVTLDERLFSHLNTLESFAHLGRDLDLLLATFRSATPLRVMLLGEPGDGRGALVRTLMREAKLSQTVAIKERDEGLRDIQQEELVRAHLAGRALRHHVLVVDLPPSEKDLSSSVGRLQLQDLTPTLHEVWMARSVSELPANVVHHFDLVVTMPTMPLEARQRLASTLLGEDVAERAAQSVSLPGDLLAMRDWADRLGVRDWNAISGCLLGQQRARVAHRKESGQLPVSLYPPGSCPEGFSAVVGEESNVRRAKELVQALSHPERYAALGVQAPKGLLLLGGPGTGKTHLARAMAGEAGVNLLVADAAAMASAPETIPAVFAEARKQAPAILFIDEIDAIGATAGPDAPPQRQMILNRLLTELDGFEALDKVLVIGATHRADLLDRAVTRAGRLGHSLYFKQPEREQRTALWRYYTRNIALAEDVAWEQIARRSTGMTPADIAQTANDAGLRAVRDGKTQVETAHFLAAIEEHLWGEYDDKLPMAEDERWRTAVHETGHAMLAWRGRSNIDLACVRPQGGNLGFVRTFRDEGYYSRSAADLTATISMMFGGIAAENVIFGAHTSGGIGDLESARQVARLIVRRLGMHEAFPAGIASGMFEPPASASQIRLAELKETEILSQAREGGVKWLTQHADTLRSLASRLLEAREMDGSEVEAFLDQALGDTHRLPKHVHSLPLEQAAAAILQAP